MRCKFCFATFQDVKSTVLPKGHLPKDLSLSLVAKLADFGFEKITFAGGEPTLCPWLPDLIQSAKEKGMTTMVVTNGSSLNERWLTGVVESLDWVALSIDSAVNFTNLKTGRAIVGRRVIAPEMMVAKANLVRSLGIRLKVNTVVTSKNWLEDLCVHLIHIKPERWKVFQVLPVKGQNDTFIDDFTISKTQFNQFLSRHQHLSDFFPVVPESNRAMRGSYVMVDPAGRFYDSVNGGYRYSRPILEVGVPDALGDVTVNEQGFYNRGGFYDW